MEVGKASFDERSPSAEIPALGVQNNNLAVEENGPISPKSPIASTRLSDQALMLSQAKTVAASAVGTSPGLKRRQPGS